MRKVILYIACSLDGYIARKDNSLDWLENLPNPYEIDHGYQQLLDRTDTNLMGRKTYAALQNFDIPFPYPDRVNYVFTQKTQEPNKFVSFIHSSPADFVNKLKHEDGKDIWLIGGGEINTLLLNAGLIDEIIISYAPCLLGDGIPCFAFGLQEKKFNLVHSESFPTGIVQMIFSPNT